MDVLIRFLWYIAEDLECFNLLVSQGPEVITPNTLFHKQIVFPVHPD
jgi:hypothetical protein